MRVLRQFGLAQGLLLIALLTLFSWTSEAMAYPSKSSRERGVSVNVRPVQLMPGQPAKFEVRLNTHSANLNQEMVAVSRLRDDQGRVYDPVSWQGAPPGGHHRMGVLEFPTLKGNPKKVSLIIWDIAKVPERIFEWQMEL